MVNTDLILLVPAYNPAPGWYHTFEGRYLEFCRALGKSIHVILINDGSTTDLSEGVEYLRIQLGNFFIYISYPENRGKGAALKFGVSTSDSPLFMFTDIDFPYSTESMVHVYNAIKQGKGIVTGYRQEAYYADVSVFRTIMSKTLRWLNKTLLGLPVNDTQCGLKAFDYDVKMLLLQCRTDRFLIDLELLLSVTNRKYNITPVLVELRHDIDFTRFNSSVLLREVFNFFILIWKYRILKQ